MVTGLTLLGWFGALAQTNPNAPTTQWVPVLYGNNNFPDPSGDQQTGSAESDIVGNPAEPSLYLQLAGGYLGFRLRVGADVNPPGFKGCAFVGLDVNATGTLDLFVGVDNQGSHNQIGIWLPGSGANTSPSTTTIANSPAYRYAETALNYSFTSVSAATDPTASNFDLNGDGRPDQFLTFYLPFSDLASALATEGIAFTTSSLMDMVAATATQPNSLNEDLNGVNGGINSSQTWAQLGATSLIYSPASTGPVNVAPVPEPSSDTLCALACGAALCQLVILRRRR